MDLTKEIHAVKEQITLLRRRKMRIKEMGKGSNFKSVIAIKDKEPLFFKDVNECIDKLGTITLKQGHNAELDLLKNQAYSLIKLRNEDCIGGNYNVTFK